MGTALLPIIVGSLISTAGGIAAQSLTKKSDDPPLLTPEDPAQIGREGEIAARRMAEQRRISQGKGGRASTIFAGGQPLGISGETASAKKTLTG